MKKRVVEMSKYILSLFCFYAIINHVRNVFGVPVVYDVFVRSTVARGKEVVIIGPYYSRRGFVTSSCVCTFSGGSASLEPVIVDDPDMNCLVVLFRLPAGMPDAFDYVVMRGKKKLFLRSYRPVDISAKRTYGLSIATLFKYETEYLREWIDYHRGVGVEHFYLYENNRSPDLKIAGILAPYVREGLVTHILWPYPYEFYNYKLRKLWPNDAFAYTQVPQINHALYKFAAETEWLLSCDVDEYFYSPKGAQTNSGELRKLTGVVETINAAHDVSSIRIQGFWFGGTPDEVVKAKSAGVLSTFIRSEREPRSACKCIFDTASVRLASVHNSLVHEKKEITVDPGVVRFNHYRALGWKRRFDPDFAREAENRDIFA